MRTPYGGYFLQENLSCGSINRIMCLQYHTHTHTHIPLQLPHSLSLILALLPRRPYSLLLHIPRRSCRLWISLSSRIQTKETPSDFQNLHLNGTFVHSASPHLYHTQTHTHILRLSHAHRHTHTQTRARCFSSQTEEQWRDWRSFSVFGSCSLGSEGAAEQQMAT